MRARLPQGGPRRRPKRADHGVGAGPVPARDQCRPGSWLSPQQHADPEDHETEQTDHRKNATRGLDIHEPSLAAARKAAQEAGVDQRARFETGSASELRGTGYDLVCLFDCLHDMGDPVGAARHIRRALAPDGTLLLVEPLAGDGLEDNLNPVGRTYYGFSTVICTPTSLAQEVGLGLGAQAGELRLGQVLREAGFTHVRRATETPFNLILEARP
jgi:SAM-dependent methyltransferase